MEEEGKKGIEDVNAGIAVMLDPGVSGDAGPRPQLTLPQPRGEDYAHYSTTHPSRSPDLLTSLKSSKRGLAKFFNQSFRRSKKPPKIEE